MFVHIFSFIWKAEATAADKARAVEAIAAFGGAIDGLDSVLVGDNVSPKAAGYTTTGVMSFTSEAAFDAYATHPLHLALLDWLVPLIDALEIDFTVAARG
ncbi:Dabb family protein [Sphingobium sufflavum]|uniref:Dabb family protein n=1 Tax=Sphingobium sufflavum TaxID=1129547 RepID=UPI001F40070D|nr:Dabb family protein [Sphingobium sufflavum]MCE7796155.1 Dabb family protein [Sphingobium sufflavum]